MEEEMYSTTEAEYLLFIAMSGCLCVSCERGDFAGGLSEKGDPPFWSVIGPALCSARILDLFVLRRQIVCNFRTIG